uniref:RBR-type E3 ubiquitin transferase n=1 Tax=Oreochromis niloticus TaxID=8128 RepID=A0A669F8J5_ORENI
MCDTDFFTSVCLFSVLCEGFKSLRAKMSCGHAVTPTSLTNWCRRLLEQVGLIDILLCIKYCPTSVSMQCPGCGSTVVRENGSDLNVLCKVCTAVKGRPFEFCWQCLREWKGARPRKDRCGNRGCCNPSLETLKKCPDITLYEDEYECQYGVHVCPSVRACPTCGLLLEHSKKDCPSVDCPRCSVTFCFVCLKHSGECFTSCIAAPRQTSIPVKASKTNFNKILWIFIYSLGPASEHCHVKCDPSL